MNWALACAIFISIFSVSDKVVVAATPPLVYIWWVIAGDTILWFPIVWRRLPLRKNFGELRRNWGGIIATGIAMTAAYVRRCAGCISAHERKLRRRRTGPQRGDRGNGWLSDAERELWFWTNNWGATDGYGPRAEAFA